MSKNRKTAQNPAGVAPPLKGYYSNCVRADSGPLLFIAGQISTDAAGKIVGVGDLRAQTTQVLENIRTILRANNADMENIVNVTVYVTECAPLKKWRISVCSIFRKMVPQARSSRSLGWRYLT